MIIWLDGTTVQYIWIFLKGTSTASAVQSTAATMMDPTSAGTTTRSFS